MLKNEGQFKALHIGDIHWGAISPKKMYKELVDIFIDYVKKHGSSIDFIFIHGDMFDTKISLTEPASIYANKFFHGLLRLCKQKDIEVRIIKGTKTHDFNQLDNFKTYEKTFKNLKIINTISEEEYCGVKILYVPEEYMNDQNAFYAEYKEREYNYIIGHGTWDVFAFQNQIQESERLIHGSPVFKYNEWENAVKDGLIIFGHIHTRNKHKKLYYIGSYSRWCFGEEKPKGFLVSLTNLEDKSQKVKFIENTEAEQYETVTLDKADDESIEETVDNLQSLLTENDNSHFRIKVGKDDVSVADLKILREVFSETDTIKIELSSVKDKLLEDKDEKETDFLKGEPVENIEEFIKQKHNFEISKEEIVEIVTPDAD